MKFQWVVGGRRPPCQIGDIRLRLEGNLDIHVTQCLRLAYEIRREIAPYIELNHESDLGATRSLLRLEGSPEDSLTLRAGLHFWFT